jgi:ribonuclease P protein component
LESFRLQVKALTVETSRGDDQGKRYGFPREARLRKKREFDAVFREGTKGVTRSLVLFAKPNGTDNTRLGLVVSKKHGKAVKRNRIRRLLREAFRLERPTLPVGLDLVCIPRVGAFPDRLAEVRTLLRHGLEKAVHGRAGKGKRSGRGGRGRPEEA